MRKTGPLQLGEKNGRLTAVEFLYSDHKGRRYFRCECECGGEVVTHTSSLRAGNTRSCGCLLRGVAAARRLPGGAGEVTAIILGYKRHARDRGYRWGLTREDVLSIIFLDCHYCGAPPSNIKVTKNTVTPLSYSGIDRVRNGEGYEVGNVVPCCRICNNAKQTLPLEEFAAWAKRVAAMADQWGTAMHQEVAA